MKKVFQFIRKHFLTKKFLSFGIIGVINTLISLSVYGLFYNIILAKALADQLAVLAFLSNAIAFIVASVFSYFANAMMTFKPQSKNALQFSSVMIVFVIRLLISSLLTSFFNYVILDWFHIVYEGNKILSLIAPFTASALLIPVFYFALDIVFKKTDRKK